MADIVVDCVGKAVILSFTWKEDDPVAAPRYLLPMTTMEADEVTGSDALITRLDLFLSSPWRDANTIDLGNGVSLVVMTR
ncbi:hypothetical protein ACFWVM_00915 [Nocardia fluminea]|uniref:hypothetical protein n=1 Tax=Nocardia fluminea TaxID=134984 RepID=UPI00365148DC